MIGKMSVKLSLCVTWEVPNFFKLSGWGGYSIESPQFLLTDVPHSLRLYPEIWAEKNGVLESFVAFDLLRFPSHVSERDVSFQIGYKSVTGKECDAEKEVVSLLSGDISLFTANRLIFEKWPSTYVPEGTLTIFGRIHLGESGSARLQSVVGETSFEDPALASNQDGEHGELSSVDKLQADYKLLLLKGWESDACLVVSGKEFKVHRNILRARSPVFDAMFGHETEEKKCGRVVIDDLDPESFSEFLEYVYMGSIEAFSEDNVFGVYVVADKYQLHTLKSECVKYMRENLSVDSFCDVMTLALRHDETDLLELAVEFFKENLYPIILTVKWQQFLSENSTRANELLIRAHAPVQRSPLLQSP